jgi:hypothetical protein
MNMTVPKCVFDAYGIDPATAIENSDKVPKEGPGGQWPHSWNKAGEHQCSWDGFGPAQIFGVAMCARANFLFAADCHFSRQERSGEAKEIARGILFAASTVQFSSLVRRRS